MTEIHVQRKERKLWPWVSAVRTAANAVDEDRPLLEQRDAVKTFFDRSVEAVRSMGAPEPVASANDGGR